MLIWKLTVVPELIGLIAEAKVSASDAPADVALPADRVTLTTWPDKEATKFPSIVLLVTVGAADNVKSEGYVI